MTPDAREGSDDETTAPALVLEVRADGEWHEFGRFGPSAPPSSVSHNGPGGRQVYLFRCCGDYSVLQRSKAGADLSDSHARVLLSSAGLESVARLTAENPTADFWLRPGDADELMHFRFRHQP
jgi:hypothetical protein